MAYTLGLDLGTNSIGWALVDEDAKRILRSGVRVFPEGVDRDKQGGEISKNEGRRRCRGMRRQVRRRAARKKALRQALKLAGLAPEVPAQCAALDRVDPYELRVKGLDEKLHPFELGRALIHINQRRGFKSNRKKARSGEEKGMLAEIAELQSELEQARARTIGEYLRQLQSSQGPLARLRGRHTRREMFAKEFDLLWNKQKEFYPALLTDGLRAELWERLIAHQRRMYWPKSAVGACDLEPRERRCRREHRVAQRFRMFQEVNNLRIVENTGELRALTQAERSRIIKQLCEHKERTFDEIRAALGLEQSQGFNLEFGDRRKLLGLSTDVLLAGRNLFGKKWGEVSDDQKNRIVDAILDDDAPPEELARLAREEWGLDAPTAQRLAEADFKPGYANYSMKAMLRLTPFLENGLPLSGRDGEHDALHAAGYLRPDERARRLADTLPEPPEMPNPIVRAALLQVRQVVNSIIRECGKPSTVNVELARDVKGSAAQRDQMARRMREQERTRAAAADAIRAARGIDPRRSDIERYILWEQQNRVCIYSGKPIGVAQLFNGDVDVDHILPYSRSLDNSHLNKVLAFRVENQAKGNRTPYEWLAHESPGKYESVLQRAAALPVTVRNAKRPKFAIESLELNDFIHRQLSDTRYISRKVAEYVACLGTNVICTKGSCTADLRHYLGLDSVLRADGLGLKNREDHRHHAVDAIAIALTNRSRLQALARLRGSGGMPPPWDGFRHAVEESVDAINVSFRVHRRVCGPLHEETLYGPTHKPWKIGHLEHGRDATQRPWAATWVEDCSEYVYRKPLRGLTPGMVADIRDPTVRALVEQRLRDHGIAPGQGGKIPPSVWNEPLRMAGVRGAVVKKVRLRKRDATIKAIRSGNAFVKTGSNHHVCIFEVTDGTQTMQQAIWVSMLEAAGRVRAKKPVIQRIHPLMPDARFVMSLSPGELVLGNFRGRQCLCVYRTGASTTNQLFFAEHRDARDSGAYERIRVNVSVLEAKKVTVDPLGRIRWAND